MLRRSASSSRGLQAQLAQDRVVRQLREIAPRNGAPCLADSVAKVHNYRSAGRGGSLR